MLSIDQALRFTSGSMSIESDEQGRCQDLKTRGIWRIYVDHGLICGNPGGSVVRLHPVHLIIGSDYQLVQRVAVDAKSRGPHADADAGEAISAYCEGELRNSTLDTRA